ncbi:MAG: hypothetical protein A4E57_04150 [Syntrophorhabdaceae bacterium PtaU1.Bin034]|nr:MAG: hypothetical protein A4E57_04150 [Syntrophorhabdaceae bacterium PtaU1.Bin034]
MKKSLIVIAALLLALPVVSHAGSATSRWDMVLGGYVKFDVVYADKAVGTDNRASSVDSKGSVDLATDSTSSLTWAGAETRLNWAVKGPDAWGAKTSAFVEGEFRGRTGGTEYGLFALRHAYMQMIWPKTTLLIGHTWQAWGMIPSLQILAFSEEHFNKGATRVPQIRLTQALTKNFTGVFAVQAPYATSQYTSSHGNVGIDARANGLYPDIVMDFSYATDACGKIGSFGLKVGVGGFYGKDKYLVDNAAGAAVNFEDEKVDRYGAGFYWYVPIIPEKKGNKAGALGFTGQLFGGKGMGIYLPAYISGAYDRANNDTVRGLTSTYEATATDLAYPMTYGGWMQGTFYFTNQLFMNAVYGAQFNRVSNRFKDNQPRTVNATTGFPTAGVERIQNFIVNVMYDVNPAIRFGLEYDYVTTAYAFRETVTTSNKGSFNSVRFGAYYFF